MFLIPRQLFQFTLLTFVGFVVCVWTRLIHWVYLVGKFAMVWFNDEAWGFLGVGISIALIFTLFSWVFCIETFYKRFMKFYQKYREHQILAQDAPSSRRCSSAKVCKPALENEQSNKIFMPRRRRAIERKCETSK